MVAKAQVLGAGVAYGYILSVNGKSVIKMSSLRKLHAAVARTAPSFLSFYLSVYLRATAPCRRSLPILMNQLLGRLINL